MKTIKGYQYVVTATEDVTITDENGLNLTCPAGQQTYFVATSDEVEVVGDGTVTQTRGGIIAGGGGGGGGGEKIAPGEVVVGGTQESAFILQLNECTECPMFLSELPEGVTLEKLQKGTIFGLRSNYGSAFTFDGGHYGGGIFSGSVISALPSTLNLTNLTDGRYMFNRSTLTSFESDLPALDNGNHMFYYCTSLTSFSGDLSALTNGGNMFYKSILTSWDVDLPALSDGNYMFSNSGLTSWNVALPALTNGEKMFDTCKQLQSFNANMPLLTKGGNMFNACNNLQTFSGNMPSLTSGRGMFQSSSVLKSFTSDLTSLTDGGYMFWYCSLLSSFNAELPSLSTASSMFQYCKLDLESLNRIVTSVPSYTSGSHPIYIGVSSTQVTQAQQDSANATLVAKGWTVTWQRN